MNALTRAISDFVQASLEHGSVSLVLLAGGVGKRMGVDFLISACTCMHLLDAVGYCWNTPPSITSCCLWPKLVLRHTIPKQGPTMQCSWDP